MPSKSCPACGYENGVNADSCQRCGGSLRSEGETEKEQTKAGDLAGEPDAQSVLLVTLPTALDAQLVGKHLEDVGIRFVAAADDCGGLYPFLTSVSGIRILVKETDLSRAREVLRDIQEQYGIVVRIPSAGRDADFAGSGTRPPTSSTWVQLGIFLFGAAVGAFVYAGFDYHHSHFTGTRVEDRNGDGRPDAWWEYNGGQLVKFSADDNFDHRPDSWYYYSNDRMVSAEFDVNFDGKVDSWVEYDREIMSRRRDDYDFDGRPDSETRFEAGRPVTEIFAISNSLGVWRRDFYTNGARREMQIDRNGDGVLDERILFDAFGTFLRAEQIK